jgi:thiol-disulfide isomerase/thioredoxin
MKKTLLIVLAVAAIIAGTWYADHATKASVTRASAKIGMAVPPNTALAGKPAPDLKFKDLNGKDVALSDLKGKVVFLNFWATWCDPCRIEIPWLIAMQAKYGPQGFTVVGVAMDDEGKSVVAPFIEKERFDVDGQKLPMSYPILLGSDDAADKFGGILGYPTSFLISRDGRVIQKFQGLQSEDELIKGVESQL